MSKSLSPDISVSKSVKKPSFDSMLPLHERKADEISIQEQKCDLDYTFYPRNQRLTIAGSDSERKDSSNKIKNKSNRSVRRDKEYNLNIRNVNNGSQQQNASVEGLQSHT